MGGRIRGGVIVELAAAVVAVEHVEVAEEDEGKEAVSHELELAKASLPTRLELERSRLCAKAGVESREFSEPDKIPAEPAVPGLSPCCCCCCCWLLAAAIVPNRVVMKAALPAARPEGLLRSAAEGLWLGAERGLELCRSPDFHLLELLLLTTHFLMCFSRVEATLKGMLQNRHL